MLPVSCSSTWLARVLVYMTSSASVTEDRSVFSIAAECHVVPLVTYRATCLECHVSRVPRVMLITCSASSSSVPGPNPEIFLLLR